MKKYGLGLILLVFAAVSLGSAEAWKIQLEEAKVHLDQKELDQADAILTDLAKAHSDQWEVDYYLGLTKLAKGDNEAAEKALGQAAELAPTDLSIRVDHAFALLNLNRPEEARKELDLVLSKDQKNARAYYLRGISFILKNDCKSAEPDLDKAKQLDKNYTGMAEYYLGQCALNEGKGVEARKHFDQAIETSPGTVWANKATEASARIPKRGAFFAGGDFFYQYDTNIVPVSSEDALPAEVSHEEDSRGVVWVQAGYRPLIRDAGELGLEYHFYNRWHFEESELNLQLHQAAVNGYYNLDLLGKPARIWGQYMYQYAGLGDSYEYYSTTHRITPVFFVAETDKLFTEIDYQYEIENFDEPGAGDLVVAGEAQDAGAQ